MKRIMMAVALLALPCMAQGQTPEERLEAAKARVSAAGIPVALLETKIAEGHARGMPLERLALAAERRAAALEQAQAALSQRGEPATEQELDVAADAVSLGVSEAVLSTLSDAAGRERRGAAVAALTQLVAMGEVPPAALDRVTAALARGDDALSQLSEEAAAARTRRGPPAGMGRPGAEGTAGPPAGIPAAGQTSPRRPPIGRPIGS
jgi:hypothetical protein